MKYIFAIGFVGSLMFSNQAFAQRPGKIIGDSVFTYTNDSLFDHIILELEDQIFDTCNNYNRIKYTCYLKNWSNDTIMFYNYIPVWTDGGIKANVSGSMSSLASGEAGKIIVVLMNDTRRVLNRAGRFPIFWRGGEVSSYIRLKQYFRPDGCYDRK